MADQNPAPAAVTAETTPPTPAPAATAVPNPDNSTIRQMREALEAEKKRAADMETRLKEIERKDLEEVERLRLEKADAEKRLNDLQSAQEKATQWEDRFKTLYETKLAAVAEDKRAQLERLSAAGDYAQRYEALDAALSLLNLPTPLVSAGTTTVPGAIPPSATPPVEAKPLTVEELGRMTFEQAIAQRGGVRPAPLQAMETRIAELEKRLSQK